MQSAEHARTYVQVPDPKLVVGAFGLRSRHPRPMGLGVLAQVRGVMLCAVMYWGWLCGGGQSMKTDTREVEYRLFRNMLLRDKE